MKNKKLNIIGIIILSIFIIIGIFFVIKYFQTKNEDNVEIERMKSADEFDSAIKKAGIDEEFSEEKPIDADKYFSENSQIIEKLNAKDRKNLFSEKEVYDFLSKRQLLNEKIETNYDEMGNYIEDLEINKNSNDLHPTYKTTFAVNGKLLWIIDIVGKDITAYPIIFGENNTEQSKMILGEDKVTTSYDSATSTFYRNIPKSEVLDIKIVKRIDKVTLIKLSEEILSR